MKPVRLRYIAKVYSQAKPSQHQQQGTYAATVLRSSLTAASLDSHIITENRNRNHHVDFNVARSASRRRRIGSLFGGGALVEFARIGSNVVEIRRLRLLLRRRIGGCYVRERFRTSRAARRPPRASDEKKKKKTQRINNTRRNSTGFASAKVLCRGATNSRGRTSRRILRFQR